jgi:polyhydroxybutyrate depolymerase
VRNEHEETDRQRFLRSAHVSMFGLLVDCCLMASVAACSADSAGTSDVHAPPAVARAGAGGSSAIPASGGSTGTAGGDAPRSAGGTIAAAGGASPAAGGTLAQSGAAGMANTGGAIEIGNAGASSSGGAPVSPGSGGGAGAPTGGTGGSAPVTCPATVLPPGETTTTLQVGGVARTFILHVPQSYTGKTAVPFVIDWHSLGATGAAQESISGYKALSDQEGFIIAWPNGIDQAWNIGPCCTRSKSVDDLGFARAIVDDVKNRACVDPKRVYADGYSMGGGMSHYLACNAADIFAAVAPSAFDLLTEDEEPCHPARPITVIFFRGTADPLVPYAGGASSPPNGLNVTIHFLGAEGTFAKWATLNGCTDMPTDSGNGCKAYTQCKEDTEVTLCTKQGGSHDPGDPKIGWAMLKKHAMP